MYTYFLWSILHWPKIEEYDDFGQNRLCPVQTAGFYCSIYFIVFEKVY